MKLYKKIGFSIEGEKREAYFYDGDFKNVYIIKYNFNHSEFHARFQLIQAVIYQITLEIVPYVS